MKPVVLFVDDEPNILSGLRRMLVPMAASWQCLFAESAAAAIDQLSRRHVDILVTDMRMPGIDGRTLMHIVRRRWPEVTRIVLSGHSEQEVAVRSMDVAHQFLSKPCNSEGLKQALQRAIDLRSMLDSRELRGLAASLTHLPVLPDIYSEIMQALGDDGCNVRRIGEIVARDAACSLKLLQLVNSAYYGLRTRTASVEEAAVLLGTDAVKAVVLMAYQCSECEGLNGNIAAVQHQWVHGMQTAVLARRIASEIGLGKVDVEAAFLAGFVHDMGYLVLLGQRPDLVASCQRMVDAGEPQLDAERKAWGASHAGLAAYLMGIWGLPDIVVQAVGFHHIPNAAGVPVLSPLTAVHIASCICDGSSRNDGELLMDMDYVNSLGLASKLDGWVGQWRGMLCEGGVQ